MTPSRVRSVRITFVTPPFDLSGGQRVIATYAARLQKRGHHVVVVSPPHPTPSARSIIRSIIRSRCWPDRNSASHFDRVPVERCVLSRYRPVLDADVPDADVVVATWWETAEWVAALSPRKGAKVHFMQDYEIWGGSQDRVDATCRFPMPKIVIARWVEKLLADQFGVKAAAFIPDSVETETFYAPPRAKQIRPTFGLTYTQFANKGCDICLAAVARARREVPEIRLIAFGSARPNASLPFPEDGEFHFRAPDAKLKDIYASCDAWLFGTRIEAFGLPILEAMACRTPVIGTPAGAAPELLGAGGGWLVPPENPEEMAAAIVRLCRLPDAEWRAMSDAAYSIATRYSWDDATNLFERALMAARDQPKST